MEGCWVISGLMADHWQLDEFGQSCAITMFHSDEVRVDSEFIHIDEGLKLRTSVFESLYGG